MADRTASYTMAFPHGFVTNTSQEAMSALRATWICQASLTTAVTDEVRKAERRIVRCLNSVFRRRRAMAARWIWSVSWTAAKDVRATRKSVEAEAKSQ
jgi:hypothetical protein